MGFNRFHLPLPLELRFLTISSTLMLLPPQSGWQGLKEPLKAKTGLPLPSSSKALNGHTAFLQEMPRKEAKQHPGETQSGLVLLSKRRGSESPRPLKGVGKNPEVLHTKRLAKNYGVL